MSKKRMMAMMAILTVTAVLIAGGLSVTTQSQAPPEPKKPATAPSIMVPMGSCPASFVELLKLSQEQKKGLTFYLHGQTVGGLVVKAAGDGTVEVRNQEFGRIIIKLEDVSAIAMN